MSGGGSGESRARERWRAVFEHAPDIITELDLAGRVLITNSVPDTALDTVVGQTIFDMIPERMRAGLRRTLDQVVRTGEPVVVESHFRDGERDSWWVTRFVPVREGGRLASILAIGTEFTARKRAEQQREQLIAELQEALEKVKTLSGLLPICASCKKIRDDRGYWQRIEAYIGERSGAEFSHGLCPRCAETLMAALDAEGDEEDEGGGI